jgi:Ca2+-binding RTX toxin-like protein
VAHFSRQTVIAGVQLTHHWRGPKKIRVGREDDLMPEFSSDVIHLTTPGYAFTDAIVPGQADEPLVVDFGVLVYSSTDYGVVSDMIDSALVNHGYIFSRDAYGVIFNGGFDVIRNASDGTIRGYDGVVIEGINGEQLFNDGTIIGTTFDGIILDAASEGVSLVNTGHIHGNDAGVIAQSLVDSAVITNSGLIDGLNGIEVNTKSGLTTTIINQVGGRIVAPTAVLVAKGHINLSNAGIIQGDISCLSSEDSTISNTGTINGNVTLGGGNDIFNGKGGTSKEIFCGSGNDQVTAGKGNVVVDVGTGNSTLTAGRGHDQFIFESGLAAQVDAITNFRHRADKIVLSETDFPGIGPINHRLAAADFHVGAHATTASQHIIYNAKTGFLFYDPNGSGPMPQVHFATIGNDLQHNDFFVIA